MKLKTSELDNVALNWAVAKCLHLPIDGFSDDKSVVFVDGGLFMPSDDWDRGGPIIENENMGVKPSIGQAKWSAQVWRNSTPISTFGDSPLVAAMRCFVASRLGEEVEVPDELKGE